MLWRFFEKDGIKYSTTSIVQCNKIECKTTIPVLFYI